MIRARFLFRKLPGCDQVGGVGQHVAVHVAERYDLDRRDLDEAEDIVFAIPAAADDAHTFVLAHLGGK